MLQTYISRALHTQCTLIQILQVVPYPCLTYFIFMTSFSISVSVYQFFKTEYIRARHLRKFSSRGAKFGLAFRRCFQFQFDRLLFVYKLVVVVVVVVVVVLLFVKTDLHVRVHECTIERAYARRFDCVCMCISARE